MDAKQEATWAFQVVTQVLAEELRYQQTYQVFRAPLSEQGCGFKLNQGHEHKVPDVPPMEIRMNPMTPGIL